MLMALKSLFAPKQRAQIIMRGRIPLDGVSAIQTTVRRYNLTGWMKVTGGSHAEIVVEGARPYLELLIENLQARAAALGVHKLEVGWTAFKGDVQGFRVSH